MNRCEAQDEANPAIDRQSIQTTAPPLQIPDVPIQSTLHVCLASIIPMPQMYLSLAFNAHSFNKIQQIRCPA